MKIQFYISLLFLTGLVNVYSQEVAIRSLSLDDPDLQILYYGVYNELYLDPDPGDVFIQSQGARITERDRDSIRYFIVQPLKNPDHKDEISINIMKAGTSDTLVLDSAKYSVRFLQCRYKVRLPALTGDYDMADVKELVKQEFIDTYLPCSHYKKGFQIFRFDVLIITKNGYQEFEARGNKITGEMREAFSTLKMNDRIIIWAYGEPYPYHSVTQRLDPVVLSVWEW